MNLDTRRLRYLQAMGIQAWGLRRPDTSPVETAARPAQGGDVTGPVDGLDWDDLRAKVAQCTACSLHKGRTQTVFGTGAREASWLIVGEAPGADEDIQGEPFVGRAGVLLNAMIRAVGARREQVYIANVVKCRPPSNRNPRQEEASQCAPYLARQVALLRPRLILAVGKVAANNLLACDQPLGKLRGEIYEYGPQKIPLVVTYHPAYLLRKPSEKAKAWADLRLAMSVAPAIAD